MLFEVGVLFLAYAAVRFLERVESKPESAAADDQADESPEETTDLALADSKGQLEHFAKVSTWSMAVAALRSLIPGVAPFSLALYVYTAIPYIRDVEKALLKERKVDVTSLFFVADVLTLAVSNYFTAALGVWLLHSGKLSVAKAKDQSGKIISSAFAQLPQTVWLALGNTEIETPLDRVKANDILVVSTGEVIPVDGLIDHGVARIDQQALTGESQPVERGAGDPVLASTVIISGRIWIKVKKSGQETTVARVSDILNSSAGFKSKAQLKGEKWADTATTPMLLGSAIVLPLFGPVTTAVFINSHMGNRIRLIAPLVTLSHIAKAASNGILIKDGRAIESLAEIDTILFDKTGTLTSGVPEIGEICCCTNSTVEEILTAAAAAEGKLNHPIALAIFEKCAELGLALPDVHDSEYQIGLGIKVRVENQVVRVGSHRFMVDEGLTIPAAMTKAQADANGKGNTLIMVGLDQQMIGGLELRQRLRPGIRSMIKKLRQRGIQHLAIVSGDHQQPTRFMAEDLGLDDYFYDVLPDDKAKIVEQLQAEGKRVCFVGDGVNDAIAMKRADVSISIRGATSIATDMAEVVFMDGSMCNLDDLFAIAARLDKKLVRALKYSVAPGIVNLSGAFLFHYGILTSLVVNIGFSALGLKDAMQPFAKEPNQELREQLAGDSEQKLLPAGGPDGEYQPQELEGAA